MRKFTTLPYFNLMPPGEQDVAFFVGSSDGERHRQHALCPLRGSADGIVPFFGVIRQGGGFATIRVFWPRRRRAQPLRRGRQGKATEVESGTDISAEHAAGNLTPAFVGTEERFEFPDRFIDGD